MHGKGASLPHPTSGDANQQWWPSRLNLKILAKEQQVINPHDPDFDYPTAFGALDLDEVKKTIAEVLTTSKDWWPADVGNYGPFMIRMAWHFAGTYRFGDGRGGAGTGQPLTARPAADDGRPPHRVGARSAFPPGAGPCLQ